MAAPRVEFLWWSGCPSWERGVAELREAMEELGLDPDAIEMRLIETEDDAVEAAFPGSPTIRVDGADVSEPGAIVDSPLACRVYRRRDGRPSPLPDPEDLRAALGSGA
jgi:8-oxo-dGTP pyrophosphatase MutT (NUDIX family)